MVLARRSTRMRKLIPSLIELMRYHGRSRSSPCPDQHHHRSGLWLLERPAEAGYSS